jgi:hypothetical protein
MLLDDLMNFVDVPSGLRHELRHRTRRMIEESRMILEEGRRMRLQIVEEETVPAKRTKKG